MRGKPSAWDVGSLALLGGVAIVAAATFTHYGIGFDGEVQDVYGRQVLAWYTSLFKDRSALAYLDLYYYGGLFDLIAALVNLVSPFAHWATRHLLEALFGLIGLAGCWRLGRHLGGPTAGFCAIAILALTPSYYGMMFINPKDIPFAAMMIWAILALTRLSDSLPRPSWRHAAGFGVAAGLALAVRIGGVLLFAYLGAVLALALMRASEDRLRLAADWAWRIVAPSLALAWGLMLLCWPWAQVSPILHPLEALRHFTSMQNNVDTLYFGREISQAYHPASYLPVYLALKLPDFELALLALGALLAWRQAWRPGLLPTLLAALFPLLYAVASDPELYDAERHFLFVLPSLAVLAGLVAARLIAAPPRFRSASLAALALGVAWHGVQMRRLHPYEYAFFNDLVGGTRGAYGRFETEYWGSSLAEATGELSRFIALNHLKRSQPWRVAVCGKPSQMGDAPHPLLQPTTDWSHADFFVATTRGSCDRRLPGRTIDEVERDGVPFAVVKRLNEAARNPG